MEQRQLQTCGALSTIARGASRCSDGEPMARRDVLGMIQGWPDLALGLGSPAVAICQNTVGIGRFGAGPAIIPTSPAHLSAHFRQLRLPPPA